MTRWATVSMDSYRLAKYAVQVPCYVCESGNTFDAELCRDCYAPMALAYQATAQKVHPQMIAVLGAAGAGKTTYLGILADMLSRREDRMQFWARGAFSVTLQQTAMASLARCEFPAPTPCRPDQWNWLHCQVRPTRRRETELIMPDFAGAAVEQEIDHPNAYPVIRPYLTRSAGAIVLLDGADLESGDQSQDFFAMKLMSYLCELDGNPKKGWPARPVAFVFTKADASSTCLDDPTGYAQKRTPGLWRQCQQRLRRHQFFAASVVGASAYEIHLGIRVSVPLRIEPHGVVEPFEWLVEQVAR